MKQPAFLLRVIRIFRPLLIMAMIGLIFYLGVHSERTGFVSEVLDPGFKRIVMPVLKALRGGPKAAELRIFIAANDLDSIAAVRERALQAGVLDEGKDTWYKVKLLWRADTLTARLRLKGGLTDHLRTTKWSYRVQLAPGDTVLGMQTFSIQHPNTRNFINEWIFHGTLARHGLPHLRYDFIEVSINDRELGLHAIEQHFDSTMLAEQGLFGPVIKFDDEARIGVLKQMNERGYPSDAPMQGDWQSAPVEAFHLKEVLDDRMLTLRYQHALRLLEEFRQGSRSTSEVFDATAMARLFAVCDLLGAQHAQDWRNLRFVPDSVGARLVPIGFDANAGEPLEAIRAARREHGPLRFDHTRVDDFQARLFSDSVFYKAYIAWLDTVSAPGWLEALMDDLAMGMVPRQRIIMNEFPNAALDRAVFGHCRAVIRQTIAPDDALLAYLDVTSDGSTVHVASTHVLPLEINAIVLGIDTLRQMADTRLLPRDRAAAISYTSIRLPQISSSTKCTVLYHVMGMEMILSAKARLRGTR